MPTTHSGRVTHICVSELGHHWFSQWLVACGYEAVIWTSTVVLLTHWGRDKLAAISQTTFSNAFSWMKIHEFRLIFHWGLFLSFKLTIFQYWFIKTISEPMIVSLLTHICVTRFQWVNRTFFGWTIFNQNVKIIVTQNQLQNIICKTVVMCFAGNRCKNISHLSTPLTKNGTPS